MPWSSLFSSLRRALRWHRRLFAAGFAAVAVYCVLSVLTGRADGVSVVAASRPVSGGAVLTAADLTSLQLPAPAVPEGAFTSLDQAIGRTVVAPIPARGVLTAAALSSSGNLVNPGRLALPVTLDDSAPLALLKVGDRLDLLGAAASGGVQVLARGVRVVALPAADGGGLAGAGAPVLLVDVTGEEAIALSAAAAIAPLGFALH